jgi:hypothetical protein
MSITALALTLVVSAGEAPPPPPAPAPSPAASVASQPPTALQPPAPPPPAQQSAPPVAVVDPEKTPSGIPYIVTGSVLSGIGFNVFTSGLLFLAGGYATSDLIFADEQRTWRAAGWVATLSGAGLMAIGVPLIFAGVQQRREYNQARNAWRKAHPEDQDASAGLKLRGLAFDYQPDRKTYQAAAQFTF